MLAITLGLMSAGGWGTLALAAAPAGEDPAYTRVIAERAAKIVAPLGIADAAKASRVQELIAEQYRNLSRIHDDLDAKIKSAQGGPADQAVAEAWVGVVREKADLELFRLHRQFVAELSAELTPEQVNQVKDGMTYGVVQVTYNRYLELLPDLTDEQKATILAFLLEAREYAMDAGSSEKKHWWFGKYKGKINNYLSAAGYDLKQAEQDWAARQSATSGSRSQ
jgi:hypothetical protein